VRRSPGTGEAVAAVKTGLFNGYWVARGGKKIRRATRAELAEAYRLWAKHSDIRTGRRAA
jgi:hypothetical protein